MFSAKALTGAVVLTCALVIPARSAVIYSTDFDSYGIGSVAGQDGWTNDSSGTQPTPDVIADPTGFGHGNVLQFNPRGESDWSGASRSTGDLIAAGNTAISVSWDMYSATLGDNLWFADDPSFDGWYGLVWDAGGHVIRPQGFSSGDGEHLLPSGKWDNVRLDFDFTGKTIEGFLDGTSFGKFAFAGPYNKFRGIDFEEEATAFEHNNSPLFIDNVRITGTGVVPEPGSLALLATGLLPLLGLRRRK